MSRSRPRRGRCPIPVGSTCGRASTCRRSPGELGYQPNRLAQALPTGRTRMLAVLVPDITNPHNFGLVRGRGGAGTCRGFHAGDRRHPGGPGTGGGPPGPAGLLGRRFRARREPAPRRRVADPRRTLPGRAVQPPGRRVGEPGHRLRRRQPSDHRAPRRARPSVRWPTWPGRAATGPTPNDGAPCPSTPRRPAPRSSAAAPSRPRSRAVRPPPTWAWPRARPP